MRSFDAAALHVEDLIGVDRTDRGPVIGFDVVRADFERRDGVDVRRRRKQQRVVAEARVAALGVRGDADVSENRAWPRSRAADFTSVSEAASPARWSTVLTTSTCCAPSGKKSATSAAYGARRIDETAGRSRRAPRRAGDGERDARVAAGIGNSRGDRARRCGGTLHDRIRYVGVILANDLEAAADECVRAGTQPFDDRHGAPRSAKHDAPRKDGRTGGGIVPNRYRLVAG